MFPGASFTYALTVCSVPGLVVSHINDRTLYRGASGTLRAVFAFFQVRIL